jgi:hypothetical protein
MQEILHEVWGAAIMRLVKDPQADLDFHHRARLPLLTEKTELGEQTMKSMKAICAAVILALALAVPASAGDIELPGKPALHGTIKTSDISPETIYASPQADTEASITVLSYLLWALASIY